jgi:bacterioferritin-associated ferredoxin
MYVCVCRAVTDHEIKSCVANGACSLRDLRDALGVATQCGRCAGFARAVLQETSASAGRSPALPGCA